MLSPADTGKIAQHIAILIVINYLFFFKKICSLKNPNLPVSWAICGCDASMGKPTGWPWEGASATARSVQLHQVPALELHNCGFDFLCEALGAPTQRPSGNRGNLLQVPACQGS